MPVYMIRAGENGPVKIGYAEHVALRLVKMQADNHERLTILRIFEGGQTEEAALHLLFADLRLNGEWFGFSRKMLGDVGLREIIEARAEPIQPPSPVAIHKPVGPVVRELRLSKGLTQAAVADALGIARSTLASIETGHDEPGRHLLWEIAAYFAVPLSLIMTTDAAA